MLCFACGNYNIVLTCHIYTHARARAKKESHTHTDFNVIIFGKIVKLTTRAVVTNLIHAKFKFFSEKIKAKKASGQIKRNKLKYLHYLKK